MVVNLRTVEQHLSNVRYGKAEESNRFSHMSVSTNPEAMHGHLKVLFEVSAVFATMLSFCHTVVVESALEEASYKIFQIKLLMF